MGERLRFVARLLDGEAMSEICREFGVSRKTGYKIFERYKEHGLKALSDRSRRPIRYAKGIWLVSFMSYDLGFIDLEQKTLQPLDNPFGPRLSPMS
jgi:transposase